jgi:hypothetical protein
MSIIQCTVYSLVTCMLSAVQMAVYGALRLCNGTRPSGKDLKDLGS